MDRITPQVMLFLNISSHGNPCAAMWHALWNGDKHFLHQPPFAPNNFCTKQFLHQTTFAQNNIYTKTPFVPNKFYTNNFYTKQFLHQRPLHHPACAKQILRQHFFTLQPRTDSVYTAHLRIENRQNHYPHPHHQNTTFKTPPPAPNHNLQNGAASTTTTTSTKTQPLKCHSRHHQNTTFKTPPSPPRRNLQNTTTRASSNKTPQHHLSAAPAPHFERKSLCSATHDVDMRCW